MKTIEKINEEIQKLKNKIIELESEKRNLLEEFEFEADYATDKRKGYPYVAKIYLDCDQKLQRDFFDLEKEYDKNWIRIYGKFQAKIGEIVEIRKGGSWKNDYRDFYIVRNDGKLEHFANYTETKKVKEYLKGE